MSTGCPASYSTAYYILKHIRDVHGNFGDFERMTKWICVHCSAQFVNFESGMSHHTSCASKVKESTEKYSNYSYLNNAACTLTTFSSELFHELFIPRIKQRTVEDYIYATIGGCLYVDICLPVYLNILLSKIPENSTQKFMH
ncbi:hypothetical protein M3Y98_00696000 [Aphelenchoides besseyi]|nr:hypothetical protein M3Y98_00696000 [Aphelenchoides besseyi]